MDDVLRHHSLLGNDSNTQSVLSIKPMGVADTTRSMIVMGRTLRASQQLEHGFCIDHLFHLTAQKAFKCEYIIYDN